VLTPSIARAASIPANRRLGTLADVEHIVVLMQENRSFDHYFGTMRGVRGFGDPHPVVQRNGKSVWRQPSGAGLADEVLPFRPDLDNLGLQFLQDIDHGWNSQHAGFADGNHDRWVPAKNTPATMAHLERDDIPFHYALADAFTTCDAYHCSILGRRTPTATTCGADGWGNDGKGGGPEIGNFFEPAFSWRTYPERLSRPGSPGGSTRTTAAGSNRSTSWGFDFLHPYIGNYGDNPLLYFETYQHAEAGAARCYRTGPTGTDVKNLRHALRAARARRPGRQAAADLVDRGPEAFSEHPNWPTEYGAWYVSQVLDALTSNPEVWAKTALFLTYDENDGFFDHASRRTPTSAASRATRRCRCERALHRQGGHPRPVRLGIRVPMDVISPWSTGGWVCSETFDHTSIIPLHGAALRGARAPTSPNGAGPSAAISPPPSTSPARPARHRPSRRTARADDDDKRHSRRARSAPARPPAGATAGARHPAGAAARLPPEGGPEGQPGTDSPSRWPTTGAEGRHLQARSRDLRGAPVQLHPRRREGP
jgi:phospholipase C